MLAVPLLLRLRLSAFITGLFRGAAGHLGRGKVSSPPGVAGSSSSNRHRGLSRSAARHRSPRLGVLAGILLAASSGALLGITTAIAPAGAEPVPLTGSQLTLPIGAGTNPNAEVAGISCWSAGNCTTIGSYQDGSSYNQVMVATETSGTWAAATELTQPANAGPLSYNFPYAISCSSAGNCTAASPYVDTSGHIQAMVATETSGTWATATELTPPANAGGTLAGLAAISCSSAGNCTAAGSYDDSSGNRQAMVATETAGTWAQAIEITPPSGASADPHSPYLYAISCPSAGNCTAVGKYVDGSGNLQAMVATETAGTWAQATELTLPANAGANPNAFLAGVSCSSAGNCTAVGSYEDSSGNTQAMVATETTGTWAQATELALPAGAGANPTAYANAISCSSAGNCTAVGTYEDSSNNTQAMVVTETAGTWATATELIEPFGAGTNPGGSLLGVSCSSAGNCTAAGNYVDSAGYSQAMVAEETTGTWVQATELTLPIGAGTNPNAEVAGISCWSAGNCTTIGSYQDGSSYNQVMVATETSGTWAAATELTQPANAGPLSYNFPYAISCSSAGNCTAASPYVDTSGHIQAMVATETSGTWATATELTPPANAGGTLAGLAAISCSSAGNCTAAGSYDDSSGNRQAMVATETAGTWAQAIEITPPSGASADPHSPYLYAISCPSAGNCTAVGKYVDGSGNLQAMVATETAGTWAQATELTLPANAGANPNAFLAGVSCSSAGNCTAVGSYEDSSGNTQAMVATETTGTWAQATELALPAGAGANPTAYANAISCSSAGNCTAVGTYEDSSNNTQAMVVTETAGTWATATELIEPFGAGTNPGGSLLGVSCSSAGNCTAAGNYVDSAGYSQAMVADVSTAATITSKASSIFVVGFPKTFTVHDHGVPDAEHLRVGSSAVGGDLHRQRERHRLPGGHARRGRRGDLSALDNCLERDQSGGEPVLYADGAERSGEPDPRGSEWSCDRGVVR